MVDKIRIELSKTGSSRRDSPLPVLLAGTWLYCPPEYFVFHEYHATPATVWSLGLVLFKILAARPAYEDPHDALYEPPAIPGDISEGRHSSLNYPSIHLSTHASHQYIHLVIHSSIHPRTFPFSHPPFIHLSAIHPPIHLSTHYRAIHPSINSVLHPSVFIDPSLRCNISEAEDLVCSLLHYNVDERPTLQEVRQHPWLRWTSMPLLTCKYVNSSIVWFVNM